MNAFEVGFCLLGFTRSTRPRNLKSFSIILTRCTTTPNYLSGEESRNWRRSHASHQRKQSVTELALASGKLTKDDLVGNSTYILPISCSLCYPSKTERRHNIRGATISLGALLKLSSLFTEWGEMRVYLKMLKRLNRRDGCETKIPLESNQQKLSLLFHLDSEHVCASVDVFPS